MGPDWPERPDWLHNLRAYDAATSTPEQDILVCAPMASSLPETPMKILGTLTILALTLPPLSAQAGDRGTDAALGAVSGAVVFGPVGAVAGALVGFTAGPAIGHSWGMNGSPRRRARYRRAYYPRDAGYPPGSYNGPVANDPAAAASAPRMAAPAQVAKNKAPPVQALE
jgi:hypothetical protein